MKPILLPAQNRGNAIERAVARMTAYAPGKEIEVVMRRFVRRRTIAQNKLAFDWYAQIAEDLGDESAQLKRRECKLHHGVPIMRTDDEEYRAAYDAVIKPLAHETKLIAMDHWPVTSLMSTEQLSRFLQAVYDAYTAQGVGLQWPDDMRWAA